MSSKQFESWQQGILLATKETESWSPEEKSKGHLLEQQMVFKNFLAFDAGISRVLIATTMHSPLPVEDRIANARLIAAAPNLLGIVLRVKERLTNIPNMKDLILSIDLALDKVKS